MIEFCFYPRFFGLRITGVRLLLNRTMCRIEQITLRSRGGRL